MERWIAALLFLLLAGCNTFDQKSLDTRLEDGRVLKERTADGKTATDAANCKIMETSSVLSENTTTVWCESVAYDDEGYKTRKSVTVAGNAAAGPSALEQGGRIAVGFAKAAAFPLGMLFIPDSSSEGDRVSLSASGTGTGTGTGGNAAATGTGGTGLGGAGGKGGHGGDVDIDKVGHGYYPKPCYKGAEWKGGC